MKIVPVEFKTKKPNLRYDSTKKVWIGYRIDVVVAGKRYRDVFPTSAKAEQFVTTLKQNKPYLRAGLKPPVDIRPIPLRELIDARLATITERKRKEMETRVLNYFADLVGEFTPVEDITRSHLKQFITKRGKDLTVRNVPVRPQSVDRELVIIAAMLHNAGEYIDALENYTAPKIPHPPEMRGQKKTRRQRVITADERTRIIDALNDINPDLARIFEFATLTGLRHSEIMALRKTNLDRRARSLSVYRSKTKSWSELSPLTDRMLELLDSRFNGEFIFTKDGRTPPPLYKHLRRAFAAAGVPYGRFQDGAVIMHDARHSFVTTLQQGGIDLATIQSFTGHSDKELVLRYSHARPESRKRAMEVIDGKGREDFWREIYQNVVDGKLDFRAFFDLVK